MFKFFLFMIYYLFFNFFAGRYFYIIYIFVFYVLFSKKNKIFVQLFKLKEISSMILNSSLELSSLLIHHTSHLIWIKMVSWGLFYMDQYTINNVWYRLYKGCSQSWMTFHYHVRLLRDNLLLDALLVKRASPVLAIL